MKILVLGSGAREHSIAWKFSKSNRITGLFIAPGNAGTAEIGENLSHVNPENPKEVISACREHNIDYVFVGPEVPLALGVVDYLKKEGIPAFGPHKKAARLESSKTFSKKFMNKHGVPTAFAKEFDSFRSFKKYIENSSGKLVIKKSGLAAGKGVLESDDKEVLLDFGKSILKNDSLLVEEFLEGYEISIFALTDGESYILLPPCADFKKAGEGDSGLNTGGMGSICPVPGVSKELLADIEEQAIVPTFRGLKKDGLSYKGLLYIGIMVTKDGPKVLEYNVRFGDPETEALLPLINSDFVSLNEAIIDGTLAEFPIEISNQSAICVVAAAEGYPGDYKKLIKVDNLPEETKSSICFHASTVMDSEGVLRTNGGRCFTVVGLGDNFSKASDAVYSAMKSVEFEGGWYRKDIGKKFFIEE
ncbi:MAG: phosphoribosylamine--glycine ligase [Spirochaetales bacterium]|nr:phosphoribosylamine--glycine ligase [Spirochaetales bacterium]